MAKDTKHPRSASLLHGPVPPHRPPVSLPHPQQGLLLGPGPSVPARQLVRGPQSPAVAVLAQTEPLTLQTPPAAPGATWTCPSRVQGLHLGGKRQGFPEAVRHPVDSTPAAACTSARQAVGGGGSRCLEAPGWCLMSRRCGCAPGRAEPGGLSVTCSHTLPRAHTPRTHQVGIRESWVGCPPPPPAGPILECQAHWLVDNC